MSRPPKVGGSISLVDRYIYSNISRTKSILSVIDFRVTFTVLAVVCRITCMWRVTFNYKFSETISVGKHDHAGKVEKLNSVVKE